ncbi:antitoxin VapB family protein [archaeon]|nr:antitoxin VapB family protein [archaeon]
MYCTTRKNIGISREAFDLLNKRKHPGQSYSGLIIEFFGESHDAKK